MKKPTIAGSLLCIMLFSALAALDAQAATIWVPNASGVKDVNYSYLYTPTGSDTSSPLQFAIFDDTGDLSETSAHLVLNRTGAPGAYYSSYGLYSASDTVRFTPESNGDWTIQSTFTNDSMTLHASNDFRVAFWDGANWISDDYFVDKDPSATTVNSGSNTLYFKGPNSLTVWLDQVDAVPRDAPVPVPAAIYLLGTGLLACIGLNRRHKRWSSKG